jgi:hypothetical protein
VGRKADTSPSSSLLAVKLVKDGIYRNSALDLYISLSDRSSRAPQNLLLARGFTSLYDVILRLSHALRETNLELTYSLLFACVFGQDRQYVYGLICG